jgi:cell division inhibitor SepF
MKERMRKALGFLGLIEDEYGDYAQGTPSRPFVEQPGYDDEPEWSAPPASSVRPFPTAPAGPGPMRPQGAPRPTSISSLDPSAPPRLRPAPSNRIRTLSPSIEDDLAVFFPVDYNDSRRITDVVRSNRPIVLNVSDLDGEVARRIVDFTAGTIYALNAKIERLGAGVYLILPGGTHVGPETKARLRAANFRSLGPA